jgi:hypothetical protein
MHPYVIVLAATPQEASEYIRRAGIPRGRSRAAASASAIRGLRQATVHALPSFKSRRDKFAILAELRWAKVTEWVDVEMPPKRLTLAEALEEAFPEEPARPLGHFARPMIQVIPTTDALEAQLEAEQPIEELGIAPGDIVDVEQADAALKNRRRTRCKDCGALHFKDEPCPAPKDAPATPAADFFS